MDPNTRPIDELPTKPDMLQSQIDIIDDAAIHQFTNTSLLDSRQKYSNLTDKLRIGVFRSTAEFESLFLEVNPAFVDMFGAPSAGQMRSRVMWDMFQSSAYVRFFSEKLHKAGMIDNEEVELKDFHGRSFWARLSIQKVESPSGDLFYDGLIENIDEERRLREALDLLQAGLKELQMYDDSTGLYNARGLQVVGEQQLRVANRYNRDMLFIAVDLAGLDAIDGEGIKYLSSVIQESFRASDIISRLGVQEFGILAVETSHQNAQRLVTRLKKNIKHFTKKHKELKGMTTEVNVVLYNPEYPCSIHHLLKRVGKEIKSES